MLIKSLSPQRGGRDLINMVFCSKASNRKRPTNAHI